MSELKNNVALLVHSCDRYELLFKGFEFAFTKYWNFNANCNYYFATEEKAVLINVFKNLQSGKGEWADRLAYLLKEKITEKYVLYFQEDMWLNKNVNSFFFNELFKLVEENNWQQVKLHSSEIYKTTATDLYIEGFNVSIIDNEASDFLMSHQITLWNKDFLLKQLYKKEHPWRNERKATKRLRKLNPKIYHIDYFSENGTREINNNHHPILRSGYQTVSLNGTLNNNVESFIKQMMGTNNINTKYALKLQYHYQQQITHDGLSKPKKVDFFKRLKKWVLSK